MKVGKQSLIFLLQNMCSKNLREIPRKIILKVGFFFVAFFFVAKLQAKTLNVSENAFFIHVLMKILLKYWEN